MIQIEPNIVDSLGNGAVASQPIHPQKVKLDHAQTLYETGKSHHESEEYTKAVQVYQQALKIQEVTLGKYHLHTIKTYWRLGRAYAGHSKALQLQEKEVGIPLNEHAKSSVLLKAAVVAFKRGLRMAEGCKGKTHDVFKDLMDDVTQQLQPKPKNDDDDTVTTNASSSSAFRANPSPHTYLKAILDCLDYERQGDSLSRQKDYKRAIHKYQSVLQLEEKLFHNDTMGNTGLGSSISSMLSQTINDEGDNICCGLDYADLTFKIGSLYRLVAVETAVLEQTKDQHGQDHDLSSVTTGGMIHKSLMRFKKAYKIYEALLGDKHPATVGAKANIESIHKLSAINQEAPSLQENGTKRAVSLQPHQTASTTTIPTTTIPPTPPAPKRSASCQANITSTERMTSPPPANIRADSLSRVSSLLANFSSKSKSQRNNLRLSFFRRRGQPSNGSGRNWWTNVSSTFSRRQQPQA